MLPPVIRTTRILAYHGVDPLHVDGLTVSAADFRRQMEYLARAGRRLVSLREFCAAARAEGRWSPKLMALTFDDGYRDCWTHVRPVLKELGFTATVFVITDSLIDGAPRPLHCPAHKEFLTAKELISLRSAGWEIASHTCNHARLPTLSAGEQERQLAESKRVLESLLGESVGSFCYPAGKFTADTLSRVRAAGYELAPITPWARGLVRRENWLTLERVGLYRGDGTTNFRLKVSPLFHWLRRARFALTAPAPLHDPA
ncbi:MAG: polysaccharide deacetylase family protein [Opitutae bacterium]|nr:polysaccharide deacetylase family protein [Opitutae bacterium]